MSGERDPAAELLELGSAMIHEANGRRGALGPQVAALWPGARMAGRCRTVFVALERCRPGEILCVASTAAAGAFGGEVLARYALAQGVAGLATSTAVRDVDQLAGLGFPAFGPASTTRARSSARPAVTTCRSCSAMRSSGRATGSSPTATAPRSCAPSASMRWSPARARRSPARSARSPRSRPARARARRWGSGEQRAGRALPRAGEPYPATARAAGRLIEKTATGLVR